MTQVHLAFYIIKYILINMDTLILKSTGSYIQGAEVGALFADGLPDITNEATPIEDVDVEWISSLSDEDKSTFEWVISEYEIELTKEQKSALGN